MFATLPHRVNTLADIVQACMLHSIAGVHVDGAASVSLLRTVLTSILQSMRRSLQSTPRTSRRCLWMKPHSLVMPCRACSGPRRVGSRMGRRLGRTGHRWRRSHSGAICCGQCCRCALNRYAARRATVSCIVQVGAQPRADVCVATAIDESISVVKVSALPDWPAEHSPSRWAVH
jgi:hypothetical protein